MKRAGRWVALAGVALAFALFAHQGFGPVAHLLRVGGYGLLLASLFHVVPMTLNALAWQALLPAADRPGLSSLTLATWLRESVNGLLPVARIGGEVAAYRLLVRRGAAQLPVVASLIVDLALSMLSQGLFTLVALALLVGDGVGGPLASRLAIGLSILFVLGGVLLLLQRSDLLSRVLREAQRLLADRWQHLIDQSVRLDRSIQAIHARPMRAIACVGWQLAAWGAGAGEILIALYFLGHPVSVADAVLIEGLIQAISSVAFVVPGALGVQEGGYLVIGAALGLDGTTSLALAAARRLRDAVIFFPGLLTGSWMEARRRSVDTTLAS